MSTPNRAASTLPLMNLEPLSLVQSVSLVPLAVRHPQDGTTLARLQSAMPRPAFSRLTHLQERHFQVVAAAPGALAHTQSEIDQ